MAAPSNNPPFSSLRIQDASLSVTAVLPVAGNTATQSSNAIALFPQGIANNYNVMGGAWPITERFLINLSVPAAGGNNNKNVNIWIQQTNANSDGTANGSSWANMPYLANPLMQLVDSSNNGSAANSINFQLPPDILAVPGTYIRFQFSGETNGGNASNANATMKLLF